MNNRRDVLFPLVLSGPSGGGRICNSYGGGCSLYFSPLLLYTWTIATEKLHYMSTCSSVRVSAIA